MDQTGIGGSIFHSADDAAIVGKAEGTRTSNPGCDSTEIDIGRVAIFLEEAVRSQKCASIADSDIQKLIGALVRIYGAKMDDTENGFLPISEREDFAATDIMLLASGLLKGAKIAVFELGMWQGWTGR